MAEALPGYAPDPNPWDEGGWHHLKDVEMRNRVCHDLHELHQEFYLAVGRLREKPHWVRSFFARAGLKIQARFKNGAFLIYQVRVRWHRSQGGRALKIDLRQAGHPVVLPGL